MLEIICIIWLWRVNGRNAVSRGQKPTKYHVLTLVLWFGLEILGTLSGMLIFGSMNSGTDPIMYGYMFGIIGAALGGIISYQLARNAPQGDYRPDNQNTYGQNWNNQNPYGQNWNNQNPYEQDGSRQNPYGQEWNQPQNGYAGQNQDILSVPATVKVIAEPSFRGGSADDFYLNGKWMCRLDGGSEYTFFTSSRHNIVTVGSPGEMAENNVKFIAAEGGYAEVHTQDGKLLPERFKNFTAPQQS